MAELKYRMRDIFRFLVASSMWLLLGWCIYQILHGALTSGSGMGTAMLVFVVLLLLGLPSLIFQVPLISFIHWRQKKAYEKLTEIEQIHEDIVTHRVRRISTWSFMLGFAASLIVTQIHTPTSGAF